MHHGAISVPVGLLVIVLAVGCGGGGGGNGNGDGGNGGNGANGGNGGSGGAANHNPIIDSLTARPDKVWPEGETDVTCEASDDDDDPLTYNWSCTGGSFDGDGATVTWEAPATSDTYGITCEVTDGRGGRTTRTTTVDVGWARVEGIVSTGQLTPQTQTDSSQLAEWAQGHTRCRCNRRGRTSMSAGRRLLRSLSQPVLVLSRTRYGCLTRWSEDLLRHQASDRLTLHHARGDRLVAGPCVQRSSEQSSRRRDYRWHAVV